MSNYYPTKETAYKFLKEICEHELPVKYSGSLAEIARDRVRDEIEIVNRQGTAPAYVFVYAALKSVGAKASEFAAAGTFASTVLAYLLGISTLDPISVKPKLYPEFYYGLHGEKRPDVEIFTGRRLHLDLWKYFGTYPGQDCIVPANGTYYTGPGIYIGDDVLGKTAEELRKSAFFFGFNVANAKKSAKDKDIFRGVEAYCAQSFENRVKLRGLMYDGDLWENCTGRLFREGKLPIEEVISHREDLYELLINSGLNNEKAFEITEYVRRGKAARNGMPDEMKKTLADLKLPGWFDGFCYTAKYLFPRAHTIELLTRDRCGWRGFLLFKSS